MKNRSVDKEIMQVHSVLKVINSSIVINDQLKRRTRNGGFVSWPAHRGNTSAYSTNTNKSMLYKKTA